jgi:hypothetical protein
MNANKHSPHFTDMHFTYFHSREQWFVHVFHSRTTFALLQTNGLLSVSREQLSQYTYTTAAADTALWYLSLHTISMQQMKSAEGRIGVIFGRQSMGWLGLLVRIFLLVRCTYTCTCAVCNKALRISLPPKALLHAAHVYALSLSHWCILIHTTLTLHIFAVSTIIWTCFLLQGHFNCHRQMSWLVGHFSRCVTILALLFLWILLDG